MQVGLTQRQHHYVVDLHKEGEVYRLSYDGSEHAVEVQSTDDGSVVLIVDGERYTVELVRSGRQRLIAVDGETYRFEPENAAASGHDVGFVAAPEIVAPMPGKVTQVLVKKGDQVAVGDGLLVLEAMKMENRLVAETAGTVIDVRVAAGDMVNGGQVLVVLRYATRD